MKQRKEEGESKTKEIVVPTPPPLPKFRVCLRPRVEESVTKREIAKFWKQKKIEEEDHLFAAIKAAARIRARNLSDQEYMSFILSLNTYNDEDGPKEEIEKRVAEANHCNKDEMDKEIRVGIKDWWTKSKYAYLNQPNIDYMDPPKKRTSTYVPNYLSYKPKALYPNAIGVF
ncbi:hypothetical protein TanjilG_22061 [Lupinus angustifolius]|uniref:Uncharacterized protein n=1 Tax=Lupinus angustifolius TaxID=3871 RepID=A0A4P1QUA5_LUPAN|nr:PREDICTED: uncharacterized protein LOC109331211 [Lupinus angustifolius]OIV94864.1 hypothetical protein TanjilG_22061 [Lupinus angustifolius]